MAGDEQEEEREFLAELKARSGRDLAEWMAAITAQGFADKNETIDWLRAQGFPFARASWLERIHSNGGRPIYMDQPPKPRPMPGRSPTPAKPRRPPARRASARRPSSRSCWPRPRATGRSISCWRPRSAGAVPGVAVAPKADLHLVCARRPSSPPSRCTPPSCGSASTWATGPSMRTLQKPKMKGPGPAISHMLVLTDARQVNAELLNLIKAANARVNG